ncbi:MAG: phosphotransferase [Candidatus Saccharimonadales bacterium]
MKQVVDGGHMLYQKYIIPDSSGGYLFVKEHDGSRFTDTEAAGHNQAYLHREAETLDSLRKAGYTCIPEQSYMSGETLIMSANRPEDGWQWSMPSDQAEQSSYISDVLSALHGLQELSPAILPPPTQGASLDEFIGLGWDKLVDPAVRDRVMEQLRGSRSKLWDNVAPGVGVIESLLSTGLSTKQRKQVDEYKQLPRPYTAHFDARQSNIAWHPEKGVSIIDWSWASNSPEGSDATMFIIDLFKSGYTPEQNLLKKFNPDHALVLIGYWMARSIAPVVSGDLTVRFQQIASAASAATLIA